MSKEKTLHELEILLRPVLIKSKGVNFGTDCKTIYARDMKDSEVLEIEDYKGSNIKIIIK
jgi:hypothetical protein